MTGDSSLVTAPRPAGKEPAGFPSEIASPIKGLRRQTMKYADAGVNLAVADDAKQRIRHLASRTFTPAVLGGIGGFGGLFALDIKKWRDPVLVSSADGVGTKLKIAMAMGVHSTVGGDLVNHCINDILVQGAEP